MFFINSFVDENDFPITSVYDLFQLIQLISSYKFK